jgi:hypothetical protein
MARYRILDGVHRCVAAHRAGETHVRARIDQGGSLGLEQLLPLDEMYSGKPDIGRWDRGRDLLDLVSIMSDPVKRATLDPVIVILVSDRVASYLTPLVQVIVNPV